MAAIVERLFKPSKNADFIETRKGILNPKKLSEDEYKELIKEKPEYGNIICRCEMITEGEIMDAVNRPLGAKSGSYTQLYWCGNSSWYVCVRRTASDRVFIQ